MADFDEYVDWDDMFESSIYAGLSQPVVAVPMDIFEADRDQIVTAARRHGFMRVLCLKDAGSVHFCRYV